MAGITLAIAEAKLQEYLDAETAVLSGQEYQIAGRSLKRADLDAIREGIEMWNGRVLTLSQRAGGRGRAVTVSPRGY